MGEITKMLMGDLIESVASYYNEDVSHIAQAMYDSMYPGELS